MTYCILGDIFKNLYLHFWQGLTFWLHKTKGQTFVFHSFIHSIGMCRMRWFLAVLRSFFHSSLSYTFSCHSSLPKSTYLTYCALTNWSLPASVVSHTRGLYLPFFSPLYIFLSEWTSNVFDSKLLVCCIYVLIRISMCRLGHNLKMWCLRQKC